MTTTSKWEDEKTYSQDISFKEAYASKQGISFSPERRATSIIKEYIAECVDVYQELKRVAFAGNTEHLLDMEFERFHDKYLQLYHAYLNAGSKCVSAMIAGPSKFPTERQRKNGDREHARSVEITEFKKRAMSAIKRTLRPDLAPIRTEDENAIERLTNKIESAGKTQKDMKEINKLIKKGGVDLEKNLLSMGLSEKLIHDLLNPPYDYMGKGFEPYQLTNNNANIRRMKQRLVEIQHRQAAPEIKKTGETGIRFEACPADNRVRLFFNGKPAPEVIAQLKSFGFRWTPSLMCWQAYHNYISIERAKQIAGIVTQNEQI
jgi:hypothetical protein